MIPTFKEFLFQSMNTYPKRDKTDRSFSQTVLVFNPKMDIVELGYYDFEDQIWQILGNSSMELQCWCEIPLPCSEQLKIIKKWIPFTKK